MPLLEMSGVNSSLPTETEILFVTCWNGTKVRTPICFSWVCWECQMKRSVKIKFQGRVDRPCAGNVVDLYAHKTHQGVALRPARACPGEYFSLHPNGETSRRTGVYAKTMFRVVWNTSLHTDSCHLGCVLWRRTTRGLCGCVLVDVRIEGQAWNLSFSIERGEIHILLFKFFFARTNIVRTHVHVHGCTRASICRCFAPRLAVEPWCVSGRWCEFWSMTHQSIFIKNNSINKGSSVHMLSWKHPNHRLNKSNSSKLISTFRSFSILKSSQEHRTQLNSLIASWCSIANRSRCELKISRPETQVYS